MGRLEEDEHVAESHAATSGPSVQDLIRDEALKRAGSHSQWYVATVLHSASFHVVVAFTILFNLVLVSMFTDAFARGEQASFQVICLDKCLLAFFMFEMIARLYVARMDFF